VSTHTEERVPDGLESLYQRDLGPVPFSVDDIVSRAERRSRTTRAVVGAGVAAAVAGVLAVSMWSPVGGERDPAPPAGPTPSVTRPLVRTSGALDGCTLSPGDCGGTIEYWASQWLHRGQDTRVEREPAAASYGDGAIAFGQQFGSADERFSVVVAPRWGGDTSVPGARIVRLSSPATASVETRDGAGGYQQVWTVAREPGVHGGIRVVLEGPTGTRPSHWDDGPVSGLLDVLLGTEQLATPAPAPKATPRSESVGCSLSLAKCDGSTLSDWVAQHLGAEVTPQRFPLMDRDGEGARGIGEVLLGAYGDDGRQTTVAVSFGTGVGRFGGLYGDATLAGGKVRSVALPSGGRASVRTWGVEGVATYREMWLVPAGRNRGEMRVLLKEEPRDPADGKRSVPGLQRLADDAVIDLIEDFR
jgi:hypothetical protein